MSSTERHIIDIGLACSNYVNQPFPNLDIPDPEATLQLREGIRRLVDDLHQLTPDTQESGAQSYAVGVHLQDEPEIEAQGFTYRGNLIVSLEEYPHTAAADDAPEVQMVFNFDDLRTKLGIYSLLLVYYLTSDTCFLHVEQIDPKLTDPREDQREKLDNLPGSATLLFRNLIDVT